MILWSSLAWGGAPCDPFLPACLASDAPLEVRQAALAAADPRDPVVRSQLLETWVDGPLHDELVEVLVRAGLVPAALAARVPTRDEVRRKVGPKMPVEGCVLVVDPGGLSVACERRTGCVGSCAAHFDTARFPVGGAVVRGEQSLDDGSCGCCTSLE